MIEKYNFKSFNNPYEKFTKTELAIKLARRQRLVKKLGIPVLIIVDGWESSGKGYVINDLMQELDPRTSRISVFENPSDLEKSRPFLWRFWDKIPKNGNLDVFDRSFYYDLMDSYKISTKALKSQIEDIASIERDLYENDTIVIKFFLHQKEETQKDRIKELQNDRYRRFLATERDYRQNDNYEKYLEHFDTVLKLSNFDYSPWHIVPSEDLKSASKFILGTGLEQINLGIDRIITHRENGESFVRDYTPIENPLDQVDLSLNLADEEYSKQLESLQSEVRDIAYEFYAKQIPIILVFEGMDASGKGGAIKRLTKKIDPRGYEVVPISAPDVTEKSYHYLWRFYRKMPKKGYMTIFDRSWYGRVLVERIEGFAKAAEWNRAYEEINGMEKHFCKFGTFMVKYYLHIDKDEQAKRFKGRQDDPQKNYKITDEDWRNREKWDQYIEATNEMLVRTSKNYAPWVIVEGNDKKYARIKILKDFISRSKVFLKSCEQESVKHSNPKLVR